MSIHAVVLGFSTITRSINAAPVFRKESDVIGRKLNDLHLGAFISIGSNVEIQLIYIW